MSFSSAIKAFFDDTKGKVEAIDHSALTSTRLLVLIGIAAVFIVLMLKGLTQPIVIFPLTGLAALYMVCNTWTRVVQMKLNASLMHDRQQRAWKDGKLDAQESKLIISSVGQ